jgi:hypothetical protein
MHRQEGQVVTFEPLANLAPRGEATYTITVQAEPVGKQTSVRVSVEMTADQLKTGPVRVEESTTIYPQAPEAP